MIKLNKNRNIGSVIYVVEGAKTEQYIIKRIFNEILQYDLVSISNKGDIKVFKSNNSKYSKVIVITSKHPQIASLEKYEEYFDALYKKLAIEQEIEIENSAVYYIFDRDRNSNPTAVINRIINKYSNAYDNGNEMNGLFLLSYPSIEAFYLNSYFSMKSFSNAKDAKRYVRKYHYDVIDEKRLKNSSKYLLNTLKTKFNVDFQMKMLDDFKEINELIFNKEEKQYLGIGKYVTLSCISFSLIDLGIIEIR